MLLLLLLHGGRGHARLLRGVVVVLGGCSKVWHVSKDVIDAALSLLVPVLLLATNSSSARLISGQRVLKVRLWPLIPLTPARIGG